MGLNRLIGGYIWTSPRGLRVHTSTFSRYFLTNSKNCNHPSSRRLIYTT
ncbi:Uncharacterised protein [Vibrio cholerae]|nr:Uncharacterised protein [Vibrio cholerae]